MRYFVKQIGTKDCAYASLKMLLAIVYKNKKFLYYPQSNKDEAYSLKQIIEIAYLEGVDLSAFRLNKKENIFNYKLNYPILIPIKQSNALHMVLIKKIKKNKVLVYDPKIGIYWMKQKELFELWNGELLEVEEVRGNTFKSKIKSPIPLKYRLLSYFFQVISIVFLLTTMFFINKESSFYIPLLLIIAFIFSEFSYKKILILSMKQFDKYVATRIFDGNSYSFKEKYKDMNTFKLFTISIPIQLINSFVAYIAGSIILGINSYLNVINLLLVTLIRILMDFVELKIFINKERNVSFNEEELYELSIEKEPIVSKVLAVQEKAYKQANFITFKKYIVIFITFCLAMSYCFLSNEISLNFLMFHGLLYYFISENASKILDLYFKYPDYRQSKCLYEYYCREV